MSAYGRKVENGIEKKSELLWKNCASVPRMKWNIKPKINKNWNDHGNGNAIENYTEIHSNAHELGIPLYGYIGIGNYAKRVRTIIYWKIKLRKFTYTEILRDDRRINMAKLKS